jgi:hypothetical protein
VPSTFTSTASILLAVLIPATLIAVIKARPDTSRLTRGPDTPAPPPASASSTVGSVPMRGDPMVDHPLATARSALAVSGGPYARASRAGPAWTAA